MLFFLVAKVIMICCVCGLISPKIYLIKTDGDSGDKKPQQFLIEVEDSPDIISHKESNDYEDRKKYTHNERIVSENSYVEEQQNDENVEDMIVDNNDDGNRDDMMVENNNDEDGDGIIVDGDGLQTPGLFEGDITNFTIKDKIEIKKWPNGVIPYQLSGDFSEQDVGVIMQAFQVITDNTCVRFKQCKGDESYVYIKKRDGCWSDIGMLGGTQEISLSDKCLYVGGVLHELMHTIGFLHEQSRHDRDNYVKINLENVENIYKENFQKYSPADLGNVESEYDLCSIMHFGPTVFAKKEGSTTIDVKRKDILESQGCELGQRETLSDTDKRKINTMYKCRGYPTIPFSKTKTSEKNRLLR